MPPYIKWGDFLNLYGKLTFNGYTFPYYEIVSVGKSDPNVFAANRSMVTEDSIGIPLFTEFKYETATLSFDLIKVDKNRNALPFTKGEIHDLQRKLYSKNEVGILQVKEKDSIVFYGAFVGNPTENFLGGTQYISLEFQLISPYCYSSVINDYYRVVNSKTIDIYNKSSANERIVPDIEIEMLDGNEIEIINVNTGEKTSIRNMENNENIYIYGKSVEFVSKVDNNRNIFKLSSKKVIDFLYGKNTIKINVKDARVRFIYQYELLLY